MRVRPSILAAVAVLAAACDEVDRPGTPRRAAPLDAMTEPEPLAVVPMDGSTPPTPLSLEGMELAGPPVDLGWTQCPGVRLWRFDPSVPASREAPRPAPRYFGRDWLERWVPPLEVLLCELRTHHFVEKGTGEPRSLVLLRGPWALYPDGECVWREPAVSAPVIETSRDGGLPRLVGRRVTLMEHCRHPKRDRQIHVVVDRQYRTLTIEAQ